MPKLAIHILFGKLSIPFIITKCESTLVSARSNETSMQRRLVSKLRGERLKWGFTQREIAPLLLIKHATQLSRIERGKRNPSVHSVLASCVVFGKKIDQLFPGFQADVEERVVKSAYRLYSKVEKLEGLAAQKKKELLRAIAQSSERVCK